MINKKYTHKLKQQFRIEEVKYIPLGTVDCAAVLGALNEIHTTYGPLDGRPVYCFKCKDFEKKAKV